MSPTAASDTRDVSHGAQGALVLGAVSLGSGSTGATYSMRMGRLCRAKPRVTEYGWQGGEP